MGDEEEEREEELAEAQDDDAIHCDTGREKGMSDSLCCSYFC